MPTFDGIDTGTSKKKESGKALAPKPQGKNWFQRTLDNFGTIAKGANPFSDAGRKAVVKEIAPYIASSPVSSVVLNPWLKKVGAEPIANTMDRGVGQLLSGQYRKGASTLLNAPGINLIPGSYVAGTLARPGSGGMKELGANPLFTALDVLPYVGKASRVATKGGRLAAKASDRAATLGKANRVEQIAKRGLEPRQLVGELARSLEEVAVARFPKMVTRTPSALIENLGLGGARTREALRIHGVTQREYRTKSAAISKDIAGQFGAGRKRIFRRTSNDFGVDPRRAAEIISDGQIGNPGWRNTLAENERRFVEAWEEATRQFDDRFLKEGKHYQFGGERYARDEYPKLQNAVYRADQLGRAAAKAADRATPERVAKFEAANARRAERFDYWGQKVDQLSNRQEAMAVQYQAALAQRDRLRAIVQSKTLQSYPAARRAQRLTVKIAAMEKRIGPINKRLAEAVRQQQRVASMAPLRNPDQTAFFLAAQQKALQKATAESVKAAPARFKPLLKQQVTDAITDLVKGKVTEDRVGVVVGRILSGDYDSFAHLIDEATVKLIRKDITKTWQTIRANGQDPLFLHHVTADQAKRLIEHPRLLRVELDPGQVKPLSLENMRPWIQDMAIGVTGQILEVAQKDAVRQFYDQLVASKIAKSELAAKAEVGDLIERMGPRARAFGADPESQIDALMRKMYVEWDPLTNTMPAAGSRGLRGVDAVYMPKGVAKTIKRVIDQSDLSALSKILSVPMKVFRMSILTLSPIYHAFNLMSGTVLLAAHSPTGVMPQRFLKAAQMIRRGEVPPEISRGSHMGTADLVDKRRLFQVGSELGNILEQKNPSFWKAAPGRLSRGAQWVSDTTDDMYKVMAYLSGSKKALRKGMSPEAARQMGIELAHKVLVDFDRLTPLERTAVRSVIPFYSWSQHILKYAMSYPFDHPWRAAIVTAFARQVDNEWPEELPRSFRTDLTYTASDGKKMRYGLGGIVPWMAVPDFFTFAGFMSRIHPAIGALAGHAGADPFTQAPTVYGARKVELDPITKRPVGVRMNPFLRIAETLSPQVAQAWRSISDDPEWVRFMKQNPEAARAEFWRNFGVQLPRTFDIKKEIEKAEKNTETVATMQAREAKRDAKLAGTTTEDAKPRVKQIPSYVEQPSSGI